MSRTIKLLVFVITTLLFACLPNTLSYAEKSVDYSLMPLLKTGKIDKPSGLVMEKDGSLLFSSTRTHKIYRYKDGQVELVAGLDLLDNSGSPMSGLHDDEGERALFSSPSGLAIDDLGNVYVADAENNAIRKINPDGLVSTIAGDGLPGHKNGNSSVARFDHPTDLVVTEDGTLYVADTLNHVIRKITVAGDVSTITKEPNRPVEINKQLVVNGGDFADGSLNEAIFNEPAGLELDDKGNLFVADSGNNVIRYIDFKTNKVTTVAGNVDRTVYNDKTLYSQAGYLDGDLQKAKFNTPKGLALTSSGNLLVADSGNSHLRYINLSNKTIETITEKGELQNPTQVAIQVNGDVIVTDSRHNELKKFIFWKKLNGFGDYEEAIKRYDDEGKISKSAREAVYKVQRLGIMTGSAGEEYLFSPLKQLTRAQFTKMIVTHLGLEPVTQSKVFSDVADDVWYTEYVHTAAEHGIIKGYGNGTFKPNAPITREQIALMIGRAHNWKSDDTTEKLYDDQSQVSQEALPYVMALYDEGIMRGHHDKTFRPSRLVLRETAAVIMANLIER